MANFEFKNNGIFVITDNTVSSKYNTKVRVHLRRSIECERESLSDPIRILVRGYLEWKFKDVEHPEDFKNLPKEFIDRFNLNRTNEADVYLLNEIIGPRMVDQTAEVLIIVNNYLVIRVLIDYYQYFDDNNVFITSFKLVADGNSWNYKYKHINDDCE